MCHYPIALILLVFAAYEALGAESSRRSPQIVINAQPNTDGLNDVRIHEVIFDHDALRILESHKNILRAWTIGTIEQSTVMGEPSWTFERRNGFPEETLWYLLLRWRWRLVI